MISPSKATLEGSISCILRILLDETEREESDLSTFLRLYLASLSVSWEIEDDEGKVVGIVEEEAVLNVEEDRSSFL